MENTILLVEDDAMIASGFVYALKQDGYAVTHSGTGISRAEIVSLFKRFEGSRSDKGYGIGLSLSLAIMRGQNGDIEITSGGNGSGATITLKYYK